jgi:hypothetical protein
LTRLCGLMDRRWRLIGYFPILYNPFYVTIRHLFPRGTQEGGPAAHGAAARGGAAGAAVGAAALYNVL